MFNLALAGRGVRLGFNSASRAIAQARDVLGRTGRSHIDSVRPGVVIRSDWKLNRTGVEPKLSPWWDFSKH